MTPPHPGQGRLVPDPYHSQGRLFDGAFYTDLSGRWLEPHIGDDLLSDDDAHDLLYTHQPTDHDDTQTGGLEAWT